MNFFQIIMLASSISGEIAKAMQDDYVSLQEIVEIVDRILRQSVGKGLNDVGLRISEEDGRNKVELVF